MRETRQLTNRVAIACGGTGGHLFPGLAVAQELAKRGCGVTLFISCKEVDQLGTRGLSQFDLVPLPAVGLVQGQGLRFLGCFRAAYRLARAEFCRQPPRAVLAMGGFTSAPPVLAGKRLGVRTFLHESNTIPGRANRWLSWVVDGAFVGFESAARRLHSRGVRVTGTPVRPGFTGADAGVCRARFGLDPVRPVVLVMGGSQGASGINEVVSRALPHFAQSAAHWQWLHLTGGNDLEKVKRAYAGANTQAVVQSFCSEMDAALGAATVAISRAGASSLAELAAARLPAVLIPYPAATDDHQYFNARAYADTGAARLLAQAEATPQAVAELLAPLMNQPAERAAMQRALERWHLPHAASDIAEAVLAGASKAALSVPLGGSVRANSGECSNPGEPRVQKSRPAEGSWLPSLSGGAALE
jgi:UDP-N-acetylglucosamine--N-acetylmuramyl-(pentapeptide) pyrophosphoryl-undecaprenol N-acetylglucosamine transferase